MPATLVKIEPNAGVFLWNFEIFKSFGGCFLKCVKGSLLLAFIYGQFKRFQKLTRHELRHLRLKYYISFHVIIRISLKYGLYREKDSLQINT